MLKLLFKKQEEEKTVNARNSGQLLSGKDFRFLSFFYISKRKKKYKLLLEIKLVSNFRSTRQDISGKFDLGGERNPNLNFPDHLCIFLLIGAIK